MKKLSVLLSCVMLYHMLAPPKALASYNRQSEPLRPAGQQIFKELQSIGSPAVAATTAIHAAISNTSTTTNSTVTSGITNPDVARNITVTTGGSTGDCKAGNVVIRGTDILGRSLTENLAITDNQNGTTTGNSAFKTVTSITVPYEDSPALCTFAIGSGTKLGLNRCLDKVWYLENAIFNDVIEATRPTIATSASAVSGNTIILNSTLDGSAVKAIFFHNYRCVP